MNVDEENSLKDFLEKEFRKLDLLHEAKWVLEELKNLDTLSANREAQKIILRRKTGEALAYILGHWDFRKLKLQVGRGVLIPRPETEELVGHVLDYLQQSPKEKFRIVDFGSGSGAIAYSLAGECKKELEIFAVEKSPDAFVYLQKNLSTLSAAQQKKIRLLSQDWNLFSEAVDVIISNPPYVSEEEFQNLESEVKLFEPKMALVSATSYREIFDKAQAILNPGGAIFMEFGPAQVGTWKDIIPPKFRWDTLKDISGKERVLRAFDMKQQSR